MNFLILHLKSAGTTIDRITFGNKFFIKKKQL